MSFRTVVVSSRAKLDYKMDYLVVRTQEDVKRIHLSEISVLMVESTAVSLTAYLLCELTKRKIDIVFCDVSRILRQINEFGNRLISSLGYSTDFTGVEDTTALVKLLGLYIDCAGESFPQQLIEYMTVCRSCLGKEVFVFVNLRSFLSKEELLLFYRSVAYEKLNVLLLEGFHRESVSDCEKTVIIDEDLCQL